MFRVCAAENALLKLEVFLKETLKFLGQDIIYMA